jgi:hypothetical protein
MRGQASMSLHSVFAPIMRPQRDGIFGLLRISIVKVFAI